MARIPKIILLIESSRASGRALLHGIARFAHDHGPWSFYWEPAGLEKGWPKLESLALQGMIIRDVGRLDEALAFNIPTVVVGHRRGEVAGVVNVVTDSIAIGRMGAEHLLACGFKHFSFCGVEETPLERAGWSRLREEGFARLVTTTRMDRGFQRHPVFQPEIPFHQLGQEAFEAVRLDLREEANLAEVDAD